MHSPHPETKPLQSPAGNHPSQRHLRGTSLRGGRAEGMVHLYSAIKALIFSYLSSSCGSWQSALLLPISHPLCSALQSLGTPSPLCRAAVTVSPCPQLLQQGWVTCHPACLQVSDVFLALPTAAGRHYSARDPAAGKAMRAALLWGIMRRLQYVCLLCGFRRAAFPHWAAQLLYTGKCCFWDITDLVWLNDFTENEIWTDPGKKSDLLHFAVPLHQCALQVLPLLICDIMSYILHPSS